MEFSSSSEDEDYAVPIESDSSYDDPLDTECDNEEVEVGDFVLVQFTGKSNTTYYVGLVDGIDGYELEAKFMRKGRALVGTHRDKPQFTFKEGDEASFMKEDVVLKLPQPFASGGTTRREKSFVFPCDLSAWNIQ